MTQLTNELVAQRRGITTRNDASSSEPLLTRLMRLIKTTITHGPVYGVALSRMTSIRDFDPKENWDFWTKQRNPIVEGLLLSYP